MISKKRYDNSLYDDQLVQSIRTELYELKELPEDDLNFALHVIGNTIVNNVIAVLPRSDKEVDVRKSTRKRHVHLKDDVKYWVGKSKKTGQPYVSVYGGYDTGYKWGWINDGYINAKSGNFVPGIAFLEKAMSRSQDTIETIIEDALEDALKDE